MFRIRGRGWRPHRRVEVVYGVYCRPDQACIAIAYIAHLKTNRRGGFSFRVRAGQAEPGDKERRITSGSGFTFSQRKVTRKPNYRVILPGASGRG